MDVTCTFVFDYRCRKDVRIPHQLGLFQLFHTFVPPRYRIILIHEGAMFLNHEPSLKTDRIRPPHPKASNSVVNLNLIFYIPLYLFT